MYYFARVENRNETSPRARVAPLTMMASALRALVRLRLASFARAGAVLYCAQAYGVEVRAG